MMDQINEFLSKKPDRRTLVIVGVVLVLLCLCCLCLALLLWKGPLNPNAPTPTPSQSVTPTSSQTPTLLPTITGSFTATFTLTPTQTLTPTPTPTQVPSITLTPTITPTPNPLQGPNHIAVFERTGNVWVTSRGNNRLVELDGGDLHVVSMLDIDSPNGIAIWQDKGLAYVTNRNTANVSEVDLVAHKITRVIGVGKEPFGVTVVQSNGAVFVANNASNTVSCIVPGQDQAVTATGGDFSLQGPTHLFGFSYNVDLPAVAVLVDSAGQVAAVRLGGGLNIRSVAGAPCAFFILTNIGKDGLADVDQSTSNANAFYISDRTGKKVVQIPDFSVATQTPPLELGLPNDPYAIADLGRCVAVVVPGQSRLFLLDSGLTRVVKQIKIGKQGSDGGQGLAYNPNIDVAYVTNQGDNTVSRLPSPCQ